MALRKRPKRSTEPPRPKLAAAGGLWLYGLHAVAAALANPRRRVRRLIATAEGAAALAARAPLRGGLPARELVERAAIDQRLPADAVHQGVAALVEPLAPASLQAILGRAGAEAVVLVLDQVTDPQNVGAILRSAAAFGAAGVVMLKRHAPPESGALAKAASGALESVAVAREPNLARALLALKGAGFWCLGLDPGAPRTLAEAAPRARLALVVGAEGPGLRRLTRELCDELVRLPMAGGVDSLNVAVAAAVALYELVRGRSAAPGLPRQGGGRTVPADGAGPD